MTVSPDAIVVGAGIVGAACAYYLSREGLRVLVLEEGFAASGTTATGMGHIVVMDDSREQLALTRYSQQLWTELAAELPADCEVDPCGTLWLAAGARQTRELQAKAALYERHGIRTEVLDGDALAQCEPNLRRPLAGALRAPDDSVVYAPAVTRWLLARAADRGAELREGCRAERLHRDAVVVGNERLAAGAVINAAGSAAARLTPGLPIVPRKGHLVITDRYPGFCRHQLVELGYLESAHGRSAESVAFNVQPRATGQLLIGSSRELVGWNAAVNRRLVRAMLRRAAAYLPRLASLLAVRIWTGFRPATPNNLPLIGRWHETEGPWVAAGHEGLGITTSLGSARILTDLLLGRVPAIDAAPYAPRPAAVETGGPV